MSIDLTTEISRIDEHDPHHVQTPKVEDHQQSESADEYDNTHVENSTVENMAPIASPTTAELGNNSDDTKLANESAVTPDLDDDAMGYDQKSTAKSPGELAATLHSSAAVVADNEYPTGSVSMNIPPAAPAISDTTDNKSVADSAKDVWQSLQDNNAEFFTNAKSSVTDYFQNNRQLLNWLGLTVLAFLSIKLLFAGLNAVDDIPLMTPILKVVGLIYTVRFVWRYLIRQSDRQELMQAIDRAKMEVFGS